MNRLCTGATVVHNPPATIGSGANRGDDLIVNPQRAPLARIARIAVAVLSVVGCLGAGAAPGRTGSIAGQPADAAIGRYQAPIEPLVVLHRFNPPAQRFGAGTVGVDLTAADGAGVVAAGGGTVVFAGPVAGRGVVVIAHADGIRTEYEPVRPRVVVGQVVSAGTTLGLISGHHAGCAATCLHWGARRGAAYIDPLSLLHPLGPVRLLPWSAAAPGRRRPPSVRARPPFGRHPPAGHLSSGASRPDAPSWRKLSQREEFGAVQALGWACSNVDRRRSTETWV